mgnify:CR=1 FL=1
MSTSQVQTVSTRAEKAKLAAATMLLLAALAAFYLLGKQGALATEHGGHGGHVERGTVRDALLVPLTDDIPFTDAAAFGLGYITAHVALVRRARVRPGETVLVTGAGGGVGLAGVQLAKSLGANVIAATRDGNRGRTAKERVEDCIGTPGRQMG